MGKQIDSESFQYDETHLSLTKLTGKKIVDVLGNAVGGVPPLFLISSLIFDDGTRVDVEAENDTPYILPQKNITNLDEETLQALSDEDEDEEEA